MFPGQEFDVFYLQLGGDLLEPGHPLAPRLIIVGGMSQISGEDDEIRRLGHGVDGGHRPFQGGLGLGIGWAFKAPMDVGELDEVKLLRPGGGLGASLQPRGEDGAPESG